VSRFRLFLLKGGTLLEHRLNVPGRSNKGIDGVVGGDLDEFWRILEQVLTEPCGPLTSRRGPVEVINVPSKLISPRRIDLILELRGPTRRRIQFVISDDEAGIGQQAETVESPPLGGFGLPDPDILVGIAMRFQIAQKLHAATDPHNPPASVNDRVRDVVDLLLLSDLAAATGSPTLAEIREAATAVFSYRADQPGQLGFPQRTWPPVVIAPAHWTVAYPRGAELAKVPLSLDDDVAQLNVWVGEIESARTGAGRNGT
jgi:Nucleotidyl transferase AbiEii toxin, Type IV TA system